MGDHLQRFPDWPQRSKTNRGWVPIHPQQDVCKMCKQQCLRPRITAKHRIHLQSLQLQLLPICMQPVHSNLMLLF